MNVTDYADGTSRVSFEGTITLSTDGLSIAKANNPAIGFSNMEANSINLDDDENGGRFLSDSGDSSSAAYANNFAALENTRTNGYDKTSLYFDLRDTTTDGDLITITWTADQNYFTVTRDDISQPLLGGSDGDILWESRHLPDDNYISLRFVPVAIPEPSSVLMLTFAFTCLIGFRRRK